METLIVGGHFDGKTSGLTNDRIQMVIPQPVVWEPAKPVSPTQPMPFLIETYREAYIAYQCCNFYTNQRLEKKTRIYLVSGTPDDKVVDLFVITSLKVFKPIKLRSMFGVNIRRRERLRESPCMACGAGYRDCMSYSRIDMKCCVRCNHTSGQGD